MKREVKNQQTRRRILDSALKEFSRNGYGASSVNAVCAEPDISKGIIYHYFSTKDDLFLACVEECFERLTDYLKEMTDLDSESSQSQLEKYFAARSNFFKENPVYQRLFCEAILSPPSHLKGEIQRIRQGFDGFNIRMLSRLLEPVPLRPQITRGDVIEIFRQFQDFMNARYQFQEFSAEEFKLHEKQRKQAIDILLYGVVKGSVENNGTF